MNRLKEMNEGNDIRFGNGDPEVVVARTTKQVPRTVTNGAMAPWQYWTFFTTSILVALLLVAQVVLGKLTQFDERQLSYAQQTIQEGQQSYVSLQRLAARTYQLSQNDSGLKDVVIRQRITLKSNASESSSTSPPATTPTAVLPSSTAKEGFKP